jgi:hypothetical protein
MHGQIMPCGGVEASHPAPYQPPPALPLAPSPWWHPFGPTVHAFFSKHRIRIPSKPSPPTHTVVWPGLLKRTMTGVAAGIVCNDAPGRRAAKTTAPLWSHGSLAACSSHPLHEARHTRGKRGRGMPRPTPAPPHDTIFASEELLTRGQPAMRHP